MTTPATGPCPCWTGPVSLHSGHCCFRGLEAYDAATDTVVCGHDAAGMALAAKRYPLRNAKSRAASG